MCWKFYLYSTQENEAVNLLLKTMFSTYTVQTWCLGGELSLLRCFVMYFIIIIRSCVMNPTLKTETLKERISSGRGHRESRDLVDVMTRLQNNIILYFVKCDRDIQSLLDGLFQPYYYYHTIYRGWGYIGRTIVSSYYMPWISNTYNRWKSRDVRRIKSYYEAQQFEYASRVATLLHLHSCFILVRGCSSFQYI